MIRIKKLTTNAGAPVPDDQNATTAGPRGPMLLHDHHVDPVYYPQPGALFRLLRPELRHIGNLKADPAYGEGVAKALGIETRRSEMTA